MHEPIISIEQLSKLYYLGSKEERPDTLVAAVKNICASPFRNFSRLKQAGRTTDNRSKAKFDENILWALRDVSLSVNEGEVVGIIGKNGAGKSTLLKVLSRITEPSFGRVKINGRISSLLEVGTGFHPELTGRENIYMNGTILGMTKHEIDRKFEQIVEFSGIEKFLDTPSKRYSSGMLVRLAFSVAAHLEPEILIIDEVLAVGDAEFQHRCLGKMRDVARSGRTVLFVSHNLPAVESLCSHAVEITSGQISNIGNPRDLIPAYRKKAINHLDIKQGNFSNCRFIRNITLLDSNGSPVNQISLGTAISLKIFITADRPINNPQIGIGIDTAGGERALSIHTPKASQAIGQLNGEATVTCEIGQFPLSPGSYSLRVVITERGQEIDSVDEAMLFHVNDGDAFGEGRGFHKGTCVAPSKWTASNN